MQAHERDWIGLYRRGECNDEASAEKNRHSTLHECYLAWKYVTEGAESGEVKFVFGEYKQAGEYEARYFFGDSSDGQGYRCVTLAETNSTFRHCVLRVRATSSPVFIAPKAATTTNMGEALPGLVEKYCDGSSSICE